MVELQLAQTEARTAPPRTPVTVNGVTIGWEEIEAEAQHHPAATARQAMQQATEALVVRSLLLQEARRFGIVATPRSDNKRRIETDEEALIRELIEQEVSVPKPTASELHRYYHANPTRFRSPDMVEASHILVAARRDDAPAYDAAREKAEAVLAELRALPRSFATLARLFSDCPSSTDGGRLGQILPGDTTQEFEAAVAGLAESQITPEPVAAPYGFHIVRVERRVEGNRLPFAAVADRIAAYMTERGRRLAEMQYVARLISAAEISGCEMASPAPARDRDIEPQTL